MDPNLHFRFTTPVAGIIVAFLVNWCVGGDWVWSLTSGDGNAPWVVLVAALLASPAAGFLLNTVVVAVCECSEVGPVYAPVFGRFRQGVLTAARRNASLQGTVGPEVVAAILDMKPAPLVAHFEYRTDPEVLLQWRRRQRAAFFTDWATALAIVIGVFAAVASAALADLWYVVLGLSLMMLALTFSGYFVAPSRRNVGLRWRYFLLAVGLLGFLALWGLVYLLGPRLCVGQFVAMILAFVLVGLLLLALGFLAARSERLAEDQQRLWAASWGEADIVEFLTTYSTGLRSFPEGPKGEA